MRPSFTRIALFLAGVGLIGQTAAEGDLDPSFGVGTGKLRIAFDDPTGNKADHAHRMLIQPDGLALVMGSVATSSSTQVGLARIQANSLYDPAFNGDGNADGKVVFGTLAPSFPRGMALQPDGKIVVAVALSDGTAGFLRRSSNGDDADFPGASFGFTPFAIPGVTSTEFADLLGLGEGKFLAAGTVTTVAGGADYFLARFNADGTLDTDFGSQSGYTRIAFNLEPAGDDRALAIARAADGRIAVLGTVDESDHELGVAMLQSNGTLDLSFDGDGKAVVNFDIGVSSDDRAASACFAPNGTLLVAGTVTSPLGGDAAGLALLSVNGGLENAFDGDGRRVLSLISSTSAAAVSCTVDGKFVLLGSVESSNAELTPSEAFVTRLHSNGSNDNSFGTGAITGIGLNRPGAPAPSGRADVGVALALRSDGGFYALFDAEYDSPDYDLGLARLTSNQIFASGFE